VGWKQKRHFNIDCDSRVEREPMWDGNLYSFFLSCFILLVEREPMWDGNSRKAQKVPSLETKLSENQCGMETCKVVRYRPIQSLVEREPMWDGNGKDPALSPGPY